MASIPHEHGSAGSVRPARPDDADRIAALQVRAWRDAYTGLLPPGVVERLDPAQAARTWRHAVTDPPSARHHVLVAVDADGSTLVGFTAIEPATDDDAGRDDGELAVLVVDPEQVNRGHGSRLLSAAVDVMRGDGVVRALTWLPAGDDASRSLLVSSGWGPDGSHRELDPGGGSPAVTQVRLHTDLTPE